VGKEEHILKMKFPKLNEWKLAHQFTNMGIGLPPAYGTDEEQTYTIL